MVKYGCGTSLGLRITSTLIWYMEEEVAKKVTPSFLNRNEVAQLGDASFFDAEKEAAQETASLYLYFTCMQS